MRDEPLPELQPVPTETPEERERRKTHEYIVSLGWDDSMAEPDATLH